MNAGSITAGVQRPRIARVVHPLVVFVAMLALYALTLPRTITLEDGGLFQMVCHLDGIAHPPGYPLFTMICHAAVRMPNAVNGNLLSATLGALAVAMLHEVAFAIRPDRRFAYAASLAWGLTTTFWSQSIIIEVYTLAALMFMICWWVTFQLVRTRELKYWYLLCFLYGLSLSDHWPLMILSTLAIVVTAWPVLSELLASCKSPTFIAASLGCFVLGLAPYITLITNTDPKMAVFGGIHSFKGLVHYIARSEYGGSDSNPVAGFSDKLKFAGWLVRHSLLQLGPVGAPFIVIGMVESFRRLQRHLAIALVLLFAGSTYLLLMLLNFEYSPFSRSVFRPYPIIAYAALAIWFALGVIFVCDRVGKVSTTGKHLIVPAALLAALMVNFPAMDRSHDHLVGDYMRTLLNSLPKHAVLFVQGDNETGPIGFLHYVDGVRPDVDVHDWQDLVFDNRLVSPFASQKERLAKNKAFIDSTSRPVFILDDRLSPHIDYGAYFEFNRHGGNEYRFLPQFGDLVDMLVASYENRSIHNVQEQHFIFQRLLQFSRQYVGYRIAHSSQPISSGIYSRLVELQQTFPGKLITLQSLVPLAAKPGQKKILLKLAADAQRQIPGFATPQSIAVFYELYGRIELFPPANRARAVKYFVESIDAYPATENTTICRLQKVYRDTGEQHLRQLLVSRFPKAKCGHNQQE